jgi:ribosomal-protein-serine acetyltransferase
MIGIRVDDEVFLRLHEMRHAEELFRLSDENRDHLRPWMPWIDGTKSVEDTQGFLRGRVEGFTQGRAYTFTIMERGVALGTAGLEMTEEGIEAEIGYWISSAAEGRGLVSRSTEALIRFAFEDLGVHRVVIVCAVENKRSRAVPERLGFTLEGTLRKRDVNPNREPMDQVLYALLRSEWKAAG